MLPMARSGPRRKVVWIPIATVVVIVAASAIL